MLSGGSDTARLSPVVARGPGLPGREISGSSLQVVCPPGTPLRLRVCLSVRLAARSVQAPGASGTSPRGRLAASLGAVLRAESRRARWGLRGQLPAAADLLGSGSARLRPQSWGGQDPHPFGPVLRQMGQDRTFRWLPGGGGRLPNARFPPALWGTIRLP